MLLVKIGIHSHMLVDGKECLDSFDLNPHYFQLVFMDNMMPRMNGTEAAECLRKRGYNGIIIGLTGMAAMNCCQITLS